MTLTVYQCRPESKGSIHAKSSDPQAAPAIRPNYLADPIDQRVLVDGMKIGRDHHQQPRAGQVSRL